MTNGKIRTIRPWNDLGIGENPIRARRRSNHPHRKASLALALPFPPRCAERTSRGKAFGYAANFAARARTPCGWNANQFGKSHVSTKKLNLGCSC
jgi:hypothetical protein